MFATTKPALYKFKFDGITYYVIEDDERNDYVRVRSVHGEFDFPKDDLQEFIENGEAEISSE